MLEKGQATFLYLTGGLGNQLFQFAALESMCYQTSKLIIANIGHPRLNAAGDPEISTLLGSRLSFVQLDTLSEALFEKIIGYNLRLSVGKSNKKEIFICNLAKVLSGFLVSILLGGFYRLILDVNVKPNKIFRKSILVGYFQVADYAPNLSKIIKNNFHNYSIELDTLQKYASRRNITVLHVRRGDYVNEKDFGVLDTAYYRQALELCISSSEKKVSNRIWVFSDDIEFVKESYVFEKNFEIEWFSHISESAALTLLAMSLGTNFVIANSTFSWWAAQLASNAEEVYYPGTWFKNLSVNPKLFPKEWHRVSNGFI
jgi:hypothetical protein